MLMLGKTHIIQCFWGYLRRKQPLFNAICYNRVL